MAEILLRNRSEQLSVLEGQAALKKGTFWTDREALT